jgi:hypothetical protein
MLLDVRLYDVFDQVRNCLLDDTREWNLSLERRQSIKFTVLMIRPSKATISSKA